LRRLSFVLLLIALSVAPAFAEVRIVSSSGGIVGNYLELFSRVRRSGERVVIDGPCLSACTLVLSTIPRSRICVTPRAVLGFHAPAIIDQEGHRYRSREATKAVMATYPPSVQAWIRRHGGLKNDLIYLRGRQLAALYPRCN
jgi:hypothetical protein